MTEYQSIEELHGVAARYEGDDEEYADLVNALLVMRHPQVDFVSAWEIDTELRRVPGKRDVSGLVDYEDVVCNMTPAQIAAELRAS